MLVKLFKRDIGTDMAFIHFSAQIFKLSLFYAT